ncbi:butyrate kinase [Deltaproteobacteria bacterium Smac51]|nr:butyrate kinase [Deltaproteobacteria bacterium Smac51]
MYKILAINPGSTSTKIALYEDENRIFIQNLEHDPASLSEFETVYDQFEMRLAVVREALVASGISREQRQLAAVVGRGGLLPPVESGAYEVNQAMIDQLRYRPGLEHASNLGAPLAKALADLGRVKAYVYDPVTVDEMIPVVRITGLPEMLRKSQGHNLNMRASAIRYARETNRDYHSLTLIAVHLGGGITMSLHHNGRMIDMISDDEGPFSPERAGGLPGFQLVDMMAASGGDKKAAMHKWRHSGLLAHCGTTDAREIEDRIEDGDVQAALVYEAMALNVAKNVAKLSVVVSGDVDAIILTGGLAYSELLTKWITERVKFIAPVILMPGENEMESLALGALRVLRGEEVAKTFTSPDFS